MRITVLGAGAFGSALGHILESKKHEITYFSPNMDITMEEALKDAEMVLLTVPSKALPEVLPNIDKKLPMIIATKGILDYDIFDVFEDTMVLSGPGFAADIEKHLKTKLTTTDPRVRDLFETDWLKFDMTADVKGVLMCGALKNIYAIYAGSHNLKPGTDAHEKFLKTCAEEMKADLFENGANPKTVDLVCGKGDLKLTCDYPSRNYEFGQKLIENPDYQPEKTVEGVTALKKVKDGAIKIPKSAIFLKELIKESNKWA